MTKEIEILLITAASIAFFHTVFGPDHYLPFIIMAKTGKWSKIKTFWVTIFCGIGHVGGSVILGIIGIATGLAISTMLKHLGFTKDSKDPFIILAGRQTSDGDTAHVPSQVAESIGIPQATFVESIKPDGTGKVIARRIIEGGYQLLKLPFPCVISLTPTGIPPRKPSLSGAMKARKLEITTFGIADIGLGTEKIGINGSPTIVAKVINIVSERPPVTMSEGHNEASLVDSLIANLKKGGNVLVKKESAVRKEIERPDFPLKDFRERARGILTWAEITNGKISRRTLPDSWVTIQK